MTTDSDPIDRSRAHRLRDRVQRRTFGAGDAAFVSIALIALAAVLVWGSR